MELGIPALKGLVELLRSHEDNNHEEDYQSATEKPTAASKLGPGNVVAPNSTKVDSFLTGSNSKKSNSKDIWSEEEVTDCVDTFIVNDGRTEASYEISYQQSVSAEDAFLQLSDKTPLTSSCDVMLVKIALPNSKSSEIQLDVKETFLDCRTCTYRLGLHLPHPVTERTSRARWIADKQELVVYLSLKKDLFSSYS